MSKKSKLADLRYNDGDLDQFLTGYFQALCFTASCDDEDGDALWGGSGEWTRNWDADELILTLQWSDIERLVKDARQFLEEVKSDPELWEVVKDDLEHAGRDFHYTRCGDGCGFWDGDWPTAIEDRLTRLANRFRELSLLGRAGRKRTYLM
jgi:hypothetical protein